MSTETIPNKDKVIEAFNNAWLEINHVEKENGRQYFEDLEEEYNNRKESEKRE